MGSLHQGSFDQGKAQVGGANSHLWSPANPLTRGHLGLPGSRPGAGDVFPGLPPSGKKITAKTYL